MWQKR